MSTNYYLETRRSAKSKHLSRRVHLGKSSQGWTFALHVMPECNINDLPDMLTWLQGNIESSGSVIINEYHENITFLQFLEIVTRRSNPARIKTGWDSNWWAIQPGYLRFVNYISEQKFHDINNSERGPSGLLRRRIDGEYCIGHGSGTWDLCIGNFF